MEVFNSVSKDANGKFEWGEIIYFMKKMMKEMGSSFDDTTMDSVFLEMDKESNEDVSFYDLEYFLKNIFISEKERVKQLMG